MNVERVVLAEPRGFCAGVEKAIKALVWMIRVFEPPVYCYHEIVHNQFVVEQFTMRGVVFVDDVTEVPHGAPLMLSAHGTAPEVVEEARRRGGVVIDAVCPLVTKVHHEVRVRSRKGFTVLYVGHAGHEEAIGTMAVAPDAVRLIETEEDLLALQGLAEDEAPVALLAQTTLSHDEWHHLMEKARTLFPDLWLPNRSDLCFATTNRQAALKAICKEADTVIVIGSANSSNTVALEHVARAAGATQVYRVNRASELPSDIEGVVGVTAGASAPESLVEEVVAALAPKQGSTVISVTTEDEYFPPPPELREMLRAIATTIGVFTASPAGTTIDPASDDRGVPALSALSAAGRPPAA